LVTSPGQWAKPGAYPSWEWLNDPGLTQKYWTRLIRLARKKRSSLFCFFVSDDENSFITLASGTAAAAEGQGSVE